MKRTKALYHYLGSIHFAIVLIATVALLVIAGTVIESLFDSHLYAAQFTYHNPIFSYLLWGFFINILFSALRRWPFKLKHVPFLITHLGLLMILGGTLIKSKYGTQGQMAVMEGSGSDKIFVSNTHEILLEKKEGQNFSFPLSRRFFGGYNPDLKKADTPSDLSVKLVSYSPHSCEKFETWVKGDFAHIAGLRPFPVGSEMKALVYPEKNLLWNFYAFKSEDKEEIIKSVYLKNLQVQMVNRATEEKIVPEVEFNQDKLVLTVENFQWEIPLDAKGEAPANHIYHPNPLAPPLMVELVNEPSVVFIEDPEGETTLFAFDEYGKIHNETFSADTPKTLMVFDEGFSGYGVQAELPFSELPKDGKTAEEARLYNLREQFNDAIAKGQRVAEPLEILQQTCDQAGFDFVSVAVEFLREWELGGELLFSKKRELSPELQQVFELMDWEVIPIDLRKGCVWSSTILEKLQEQLHSGETFFSALEKQNWPLIDRLKEDSGDVLSQQLGLLCEQIFYSAPLVPISAELISSMNDSPSPVEKAHYLSTLFRATHIDLKQLLGPISNNTLHHQIAAYLSSQGKEYSQEPQKIECPVTLKHLSLAPLKKIEDRLPAVTLEVREGNRRELVTLTYDRYGTGLKWPVFDGEYRIRFQPRFQEIPYRLRVRDARQINYANSSQAFSFECDLLINDSEESTISMNNVHQTRDGYRFYLSNISPSDETTAKHAQIVVNLDPAKYYSTYPGAIILSFGIVLLFWMPRLGKR